jgi:hypothetical protein
LDVVVALGFTLLLLVILLCHGVVGDTTRV